MKKYLIISTIAVSLTTLSTAYADSGAEYAVSSMGKGAYVGIIAGINSTRDKVVGQLNNNTVFNQTNNASNTMGGLFFGYGETVGNWYGGFEVGAQTNSGTVNFSSTTIVPGSTISGTVKTNTYLTVDALPGYFINGSLLAYGRIGASFGNLKFSENMNPTFSFSNNTPLVGARIGLGLETPLSDKFTLGADYIFTYYGNYGFTPIFATNQYYRISPQTNTFGIHLKYNL